MKKRASLGFRLGRGRLVSSLEFYSSSNERGGHSLSGRFPGKSKNDAHMARHGRTEESTKKERKKTTDQKMSRGKGTRLEKSRRFSDQSQGRMLSNGLRVETFEEEGKKDKKKQKKRFGYRYMEISSCFSSHLEPSKKKTSSHTLPKHCFGSHGIEK